MATNIKIKIYSINQNNTLFYPKSANGQPITDAAYLQHTSLNDVRPEGYYINVDSSDVPGVAFPIVNHLECPIKFDGVGNAYVTITDSNGQLLKFYVKNPSVKNIVPPAVFQFLLNPQKINPEYKKLATKTRTRGGWEIQHWGNELSTLQVQGKTAGMHLIRDGVATRPLNTNENIMDSTAWKNLAQLRDIYQNDHAVKNKSELILLGINYLDKMLIGYFLDFNGPETDAEKPYLINYSFNFQVQEERTIK